MAILERHGIVNSYGEKSTFGAPNRKYYKVCKVEFQIHELEEKVDDLRALKQKILYSLHSIFPKDKFDPLERDIIYKIIKTSPDGPEALSESLSMSMKETSDAVNQLCTKLASADARKFPRKYRRV